MGMLCWNNIRKNVIAFSILGVVTCGAGCADKDVKEFEEKYIEEEKHVYVEEKYTKEKEYVEDEFVGMEEELCEYRNKFIEMYTQNVYKDANKTMTIDESEIEFGDGEGIATLTQYFDALSNECIRCRIDMYGETMNMVINYYFCDMHTFVSVQKNYYSSWLLTAGQQDILFSEVENWVVDNEGVYIIYENNVVEAVEKSQVEFPLPDELEKLRVE